MMQQNNKPALVFLHYFGGSGLSWQWVTEKLSSSYHYITPDLPGFGGTAPLEHPSIQAMAAWALKYIQNQGIKQYVLIGHSMSGKIAVQMAAFDTEDAIRQLILVAPSPPSVELIAEPEQARMLRHPNRQEAETTVQKITIRPLMQEQHDLAVDTQLMTDNNTWRWWITQGTTDSIGDKLASVHLPITILASEDDPAITFDIIQNEVMGLLPAAKLVTIKEVGHLSPMEAPDWIAGQIVEALQGLP